MDASLTEMAVKRVGVIVAMQKRDEIAEIIAHAFGRNGAVFPTRPRIFDPGYATRPHPGLTHLPDGGLVVGIVEDLVAEIAVA